VRGLSRLRPGRRSSTWSVWPEPAAPATGEGGDGPLEDVVVQMSGPNSPPRPPRPPPLLLPPPSPAHEESGGPASRPDWPAPSQDGLDVCVEDTARAGSNPAGAGDDSSHDPTSSR
jgi:hypothetical protein